MCQQAGLPTQVLMCEIPADTVGQGGLGSPHAYLLSRVMLSFPLRRRTWPFDLPMLGHRWHSVCVDIPCSTQTCGYVHLCGTLHRYCGSNTTRVDLLGLD